MNRTFHYIAEAVSEYDTEASKSLHKAISHYDTIQPANSELFRLTGIRNFFATSQALSAFRQVLELPPSNEESRSNREWGDFQTPPELAAGVCSYLAKTGVSPRIVIEPTYGAGNFILAVLKAFPTIELVYGVEKQEKYEWHLKIALLVQALGGSRITAEIQLYSDDIFTHRFPEHVLRAHDILLIGNPPWVTSAELSAIGARNVPAKRNLKALNGMDAITGKSNFDIGEFVLLRLLDLFSQQHGVLAMLCKNSVIKNIMEVLPRRNYGVSNIRALQIDASREFDVAVAASLLVMETGASDPAFTCRVASLEQPDRVSRRMGWTRNRFVSNIEAYALSYDLDGRSQLTWRQGLKHDCARIMELSEQNGHLVNGNGEIADIEEHWIYGLAKSSDLRTFEVSRVRKKVIVTQRELGEDTSQLEKSAPKLWSYLVRNREHFERRKSSIYRNKPPFSIFGIGTYSFKSYKVAIAGLYKEPFFAVLLPVARRPIMLDDTCYFLGFDAYLDALFAASVLNSPSVTQFLQSIVFADAKRPFTKEVLMRIDLARAASQVSLDTFQKAWSDAGYKPRTLIRQSDFEEFKQRLLHADSSRAHPQYDFGL